MIPLGSWRVAKRARNHDNIAQCGGGTIVPWLTLSPRVVSMKKFLHAVYGPFWVITGVRQMSMGYSSISIPDSKIPQAISPQFQHLLDTYVSETNKVASVWGKFTLDDLSFKPHPRSSSVLDIMKHQLLSERRFFGEFLGSPEPAPAQILLAQETPGDFASRLVELAVPRLNFFAGKEESWWLEKVRFFDVERERIWIFWRRVLHTAHHRTQLTVYLRLLEKDVPSTYGPTADVSWEGADPTNTVDASGRK